VTPSPASFRTRVRSTFDFLKRSPSLDQLLAKSLPLHDGWAVPMGDLHVGDPALIEALGRWRGRHADTFPRQFTITPEGTRRWLADAIVGNPDRLLLLVCDRLGRPLGHIGFTLGTDASMASLLRTERLIEYGYILRGEPDAPGIMSQAERAGINWCHEELAPDAVYALTFEDNLGALRHQVRNGAIRHSTIPLRRHADGATVEYRPRAVDDVAPADRRYAVLIRPALHDAGDARPLAMAGPSIGAHERAYALDATRGGWNEQRSRYLDRFADRFAAFVGVRYALPTSSCTGAMHLALLALGIGAGDEVVVPDMTWVATANAVALTGATPVFADIEERTWCLDPDSLRAAIGPRTRAVMPVHLYGYPARMDALSAVAREHGLLVLEDAAPAVGATVAGRTAGSWGDMAAFSFQGAKLLVTGEGGMLVTDDEPLYRRALHLWDQARSGADHPFWCDEVTPKYKLSNVQAALGLGQLERIETLLEAKLRIHGWYAEELADVPGIQLHAGDPAAGSAHWMNSILVGEEAALGRDQLAAALASRAIDSRPTYPALSTLPMWSGATAEHPVAQRVARTGLNLPSGVRLRRGDVARVAAEIRSLVSGRARTRA
jgi:perosamine synthetase